MFASSPFSPARPTIDITRLSRATSANIALSKNEVYFKFLKHSKRHQTRKVLLIAKNNKQISTLLKQIKLERI